MNPFEAYEKGDWGIHQKTKEGLSLLHLAVIKDKSSLVETLLKEGAKDQGDFWGITPSYLTKLLNRSNALVKPKEKSILIYRNSDEKIYKISISEFEEKLKITYTDTLIFDSIKIIHQVARKCARKMKKEPLRQMNAWTLALHKKEFDQPRKHLFYIKWINRYLGYGVFAAQNIPGLIYIGEYTGIVKRRNNRKNRFNDYVFSYDLCGKATRWCIDAREKGNFTRFLNHSDHPNLTSRWIIRDGITHIILFSNQWIPKGSQLTYCYGPWYWRSRSSPAPL
ncbi:MAG: SET domain-containing protein-lysine N-methyltransferase [Candidatus Neptunochlamydia sp.]|nr:SET domain-containing protein-lysine N-methyltransferase [Candidatus Neptunochlamydia sp.]